MADSTDFRVKMSVYARNIGLRRISAQGNSVEKLVFAQCLLIYLFIFCLFIVFLCVCFLFTLGELFVGSCINCVVYCRWCGGDYFFGVV